MAGGAGVVGSVGFGLLYEPQTPSARSPGPETWPLARFGPRNTASDPLASPPTAPDVRSVPTASDPRTLVAAGRGADMRVLVGGPGSLRAHGADGTRKWTGDGRTVVGIRPLTNVGYAVGGGPLRSFDVRDGRIRWESVRETGLGLVPTERGLLVPFDGGVAVYDRDGDERYRFSPGRDPGEATVAVDDGLFVGRSGGVFRLRPRGLVRSLRGRPPAVAWAVERSRRPLRTVALDDLDVFVSEGSAGRRSGGGLVRLSRAGQRLWSRRLATSPGGFAVGEDRLFVATSGDDTAPSALVALSRTDGATEWVQRGGSSYTPPVLAGNLVVVGTGLPDGSGVVRALDRDGRAVWTAGTSTPVRSVVPAAERCYAVTDGGRLYVLS